MGSRSNVACTTERSGEMSVQPHVSANDAECATITYSRSYLLQSYGFDICTEERCPEQLPCYCSPRKE
eukprot:32790-Eustigmatos_ZCMA.PRE.1